MYSPDTTAQHAVRNRYSGDQLATASNAKILTLCFDRLDRDLATAQAALEKGDHYTTNEQLSHAQDLLGELAMMLDVGAWDQAGALMAVYDYLLRLLAIANIEKAPSLVSEAQKLLTEIGDAFRSAAHAQTSTVQPATAPAGDSPATGEQPAVPRFSVKA